MLPRRFSPSSSRRLLRGEKCSGLVVVEEEERWNDDDDGCEVLAGVVGKKLLFDSNDLDSSDSSSHVVSKDDAETDDETE